MKDVTFKNKLKGLVLPIAFQQFMLALVSVSDTFMLGAISQTALSSVSLATQITFVENLFLMAFTLGLSILAAQYWGKGDKNSIEKIFAYVTKITALVSFMFFIVSLLFPEFLMKLFTKDVDSIKNGSIYLKYVSPSYFFVGISEIYLCILKNSGKAKKATVISSVGFSLDVVLNAILIFGLFGFPRLEIMGAAITTTVARIVEFVWCVFETSKKDSIKLNKKYFIKDDKILRSDFWKYTTPVLGNSIVWGIGFTMYSVIMGHLGSDAVATNSIVGVSKSLTTCFCMGVGAGGSIVVGNELGAGNLETAKEYGKKLCHYSIFSGIVSGLILLTLSPVIVNLVDLSENAKNYIYIMFLICSVNIIGYAVNNATISGIFCSGGDSKFGFICDTITMWCVTVPLGLISAFILKLPVPIVYLIISLDELVKLPAVYKNYKKYKWVKDLTKENLI